MKLLRYFISIVKIFPLTFFLSSLFLFIVGSVETLSILSLSPIIDFYTKSDAQQYSDITQKFAKYAGHFGFEAGLRFFVLFFLCTIVAKALLNMTYRYMTLSIKYRFLNRLMVGSFETFFSSSLHFFNSVKQGVLLNTFANEMSVVGNSIATLSSLLASAFRLIFFLIIPFTISWQLTLLTGVAFAIVSLPSMFIDRLSYKQGQKNVDSVNNLQVVLNESISGIKVVLGFGNNKKSVSDYREAFEVHRKVTIPLQMLASYINGIFEPILMSILFVVLYLALYVYNLPLSEVIVMLFSLRSMIPVLLLIMSEKNNVVGFIPSHEQITMLQEEAQKFRLKDGAQPFSQFKTSIEFKDVSFSYHNHKAVLQNISFVIKKGEMVALVGRSGSGKTTITDLMMGLYKPSTGAIHVDGQSLEQFQINSFRQKIGYVPQEPILFNRSIKDNLKWAYPEATDEQVSRALKLAHAENFVNQLPQKQDTVIGDRGAKLSGGERQRIAFARAIVRAPDILILDEATSALDSESERAIQQAIENVSQDTTVLVIAHRLSTIKKADKILMVDAGQIIDSGKFDELVNRNPLFKKQVESQYGDSKPPHGTYT